MKTRGTILLLALLIAACSTPREEHDSHETHDPGGHAAEKASTQPAGNAGSNMHDAMNAISAADADNDFLRAMIPHHQGAVDMARAELAHGRAPQIRALAEKVIAAQEAEMVQMRAWLAARGASMDKPARTDARR